MRGLVADDEEGIRNVIREYLEFDGHTVAEAANGAEAVSLCRMQKFDFIVMDIMMPVMDGFAACREIRRGDPSVPVLMLSARGEEYDKLKGFQLGIDDYMVKPIELDELLLRVRALLRRANIEMDRKLVVGNLELDADGMSATVDDEEVPVTTREFNILYKLLSYPKKTFSRAQLMDEFWGVESETSLRAVDVYITKLRDKFSSCDGFEIKTVRGGNPANLIK